MKSIFNNSRNKSGSGFRHLRGGSDFPTSNFSSFLIGKGGVNQNGYNSLLIGKSRLKNKDKDAVPDIWDCTPNDYWRDSPLVPKSLQQRRPQKPQTLAQYQSSKLPIQQVSQQDTQLQTKYDEAKKLLEGASYEDYETKYAKIPDELKQYFTNPNELKSSPEYQSYQQQMQSYEQQRIEYEVIKTFLGQTLTPEVKDYLHNNPKEYTRLQEIANEQYGGSRQEISSEVRNIEKLGLSGVKLGTSAIYTKQISTGEQIIPSGYHTKEISNIYSQYQNALTPEQRRLTQYEQNKIITSNPDYQREISVGLTTPSSIQSMQTYAKNMGYINPERYGGYYPSVDTSRIPINLRDIQNKKETIRYEKLGYSQSEAKALTQESLSRGGMSFTPKYAEEIIREESNKGSLMERIGTFGLSVQEKLEEFGSKVTGKVFPELEERRGTERELSLEGQDLALEEELLTQRIEEFNQMYSNPPTSYGSPERLQYEQEINLLNQAVENFNIKLEQNKLKEQGYEQGLQTARTDSTINLFGKSFETEMGGARFLGIGRPEVIRGFGAGAIEFVPQTLSFFTGLVTNPTKEVEETISGITQLPGQFIKQPEYTTGYITGQIFGSYLTGKIGSGIKTKIKGLKEARELRSSIYSYERPEITRTPLSSTFSREVSLDEYVFKTQPRQQLSLKRFQVQQRLEAEAFRKRYPSIIQNKPVDLIITKLDDVTPSTTIIQDGFKKTTIPKKSGGFRTITQIIPDEQKSTISNLAQKGRQQLIQIQKTELKQIEIPKSAVKQRVNLIAQTSPRGLLWGLQSSAQSPFQRLELKQQQKQIEKQKQVSSLIYSQQQPQLERQMDKQKEKQLFLLGQPQLERQDSRLKSLSLIGVLSLQQQQQRQGLGYIQGLRQVPSLQTQLEQQKQKEKLWLFMIPQGVKEEERKRKEQAYIGYAKEKGKWNPVTPLSTKRGAVDRASEYVDDYLSRQFRVQRATKTIQGKKKFVEAESNALFQGNGYWENNKYKFRNFQQRKGIKIGIPNGAIEKTRYALEDKEQPKIQRARQTSMNNLLIGNRTPQKRSKRNVGFFGV